MVPLVLHVSGLLRIYRRCIGPEASSRFLVLSQSGHLSPWGH